MPDWGSFPEPLAPFVKRLRLLAEALALPEALEAAWARSFTEPLPAAGRVNPLRGVSDPAALGLTAAFVPPFPHPLAATAFLVSLTERTALTRSPPSG